MSDTLKNQITENIVYHARLVGKNEHLLDVAERLGVAGSDLFHSNVYCNLLECHAGTPELAADIIRDLLLHVRKFEKSFDEYSGNFRARTVFDGVTVEVTYGPGGACHVRKVTETTVVPEHTVERTRFVREGNCEPLLDDSDCKFGDGTE